MGVGKKLHKLLKEANMTVAELARKSNVSAQTIYSIIRRDSDSINTEVSFKIANALGVDISALMDFSPSLIYGTTDLQQKSNDNKNKTKVPGEIIIDITAENYEKYKKIFLLAFDKIIDEIHKSYDVEAKFYNADTGEEVFFNNPNFKDLTDENKLIFFQETVKEIRYNTILNTFSITFL